MTNKGKRILRSIVILAIVAIVNIHGYQHSMVDLTYEFSNKTPTFSLHKQFAVTKKETVSLPGGATFQIAEFESGEHAGTHMDAPYHVCIDKWTIDQIPIERFDAPAVVIDITEKASKDPDAQVTVQDVEEWEKRNGRIANGSIVFMNSGWSQYSLDMDKYFGGTTFPGLHFPGFSLEACKFLTQERGAFGIGSDTASADSGNTADFPCHVHVLCEANGFILENVANVGLLPESGAIVRTFPMKIAGGTGAPTRIIATLPDPRN